MLILAGSTSSLCAHFSLRVRGAPCQDIHADEGDIRLITEAMKIEILKVNKLLMSQEAARGFDFAR